MSKPSDGFELDELRDEFDWMCEFNSRMAERIRGDADVHNLAEYVSKLEGENDRLRDLVKTAYAVIEELCGFVENSPGCAMCPTNQDEDKACGSAEVYSLMRELEIEVD